MKKIIFLFFILLTLLTSTSTHGEEINNQHAFWWIQTYGELSFQNEPLVKRAYQIFDRISSAAGAEANLLIIKGKKDPWAVAIRDGSIILTQGALKICYRDGAMGKGDSRLAFLLGHELAHLVKNDFWHSAAFFAVKKYSDKQKVKRSILSLFKKTTDVYNQSVSSQRVVKMKELQADSYGLLYMTMSGYNPAFIIYDETINFFEEWVKQVTGEIAYEDLSHPDPKERAEFLKAQLKPVAETLSYFQLGIRMYQIGRYRDAISLFESFKKQFPGREVYNNIGLGYYQLAMKTLYNCKKNLALEFELATVLDVNTRGKRLKLRGSSSSQSCLEKRVFKSSIQKAIKNLRVANEKDPSYIPGKINLSSALIMAGDFTKAMSVTEDILKLEPKHYGALNNKAVALFGFGEKHKIDTTVNSLEILKKLTEEKNSKGTAAQYNIGSIYLKMREPEKVKEIWEIYLNQNPTGPYSYRVRQFLNKPSKGIEAVVGKKPPLPLGKLSPSVKERLTSLKITEINTGGLRGKLYQSSRLSAFTVGNRVELIDETLIPPVPLTEWKDLYGEPSRIVKDQIRETRIFRKFGIEVQEKKVKNIFYFNPLR